MTEQNPYMQGPQANPYMQGPKTPMTKSEKARGGLWNLLAGPELFLSAASSAIAEPVAGFAGLGAAVIPGGRTGAEAVESTRNAMTYQPRTELAQAGQEFLGDTIGQYGRGVEWAAGKATDITGSPAVGAAVETAGMMAPSAIPAAGGALKRANQTRRMARTPDPVARAESAGYTLQPSQVIDGRPIGSAGKRVAEVGGGKAAVPARASLKNQEITNKLIREEIGLPENTTLSPASLRAAKDPYNAVYGKVGRTKVNIKPDKTYFDDLQRAVDEVTDSISGNVPKSVLDEIESLRAPARQLTPDAIIKKTRKLRRDARKQIRSDDPAIEDLGWAKKQAADALEGLLERSLQSVDPNLMGEFRAARTQLAKIHTVEDALSGTDIDARVIARARQKGAPLSGNLELVADVADHFPQVVQTNTRLGSYGNSGLLDVAMAVPTYGGWPIGRGIAGRVATAAPKAYKPPNFANRLLAGEVIGSQFSRDD